MEDSHEFGGNLITFECNPHLWGVTERLLPQALSPDLAAGSQPTFSCSFGAVKSQSLLCHFGHCPYAYGQGEGSK